MVFLTFSNPNVLGQEVLKEPKPQVLKVDNSESKIGVGEDNIQNEEIGKDDVMSAVKSNRNSDERYRIGFQDTIEINVFKHPELSQVVNVNPDGTILLPRIDQPIIAVCKTERELQSSITSMYKTSYLRNPFINVRVTEQRSQPFAVIGAVNKPGSFYLNQKVRLVQLLAMAGGQDVEQSASKIQVARTGNRLGCIQKGQTEDDLDKIEFLSYDVRDVLTGKNNPWMEPGDIVSVLKAEQAFVIGDVYEPAKIPLTNPVTLSEAVAYAGGSGKNAAQGKVIIQRQQAGTAAREELVFDLNAIRKKEAPDPLLQANDIVTIPTDKVKSFKNGLIKAIAGGIGNLFYSVPF